MSNLPPCPFVFGKDFLSFVGTIRRDPAIAAVVDMLEVTEWIGREVEALTGIRYTEVLVAMTRLASNESLEGWPDTPEAAAYGEGRKDLLHIVEPLHKLEVDDRLNKLWRQFCRKWPLFAEPLSRMQKAGTPKAATGQNTVAITAETTEQPARDSEADTSTIHPVEEGAANATPMLGAHGADVGTTNSAANVPAKIGELNSKEDVAEQIDDDVQIGDRERLILETMLEHEIVSERRRQTRAEVVRLMNRAWFGPAPSRTAEP